MTEGLAQGAGTAVEFSPRAQPLLGRAAGYCTSLQSMRLAATRIFVTVLMLAGILPGQALEVRRGAGTLQVSGPKFHFIEGRALDRLRNGASVVFAAQLSLLSDRKATVVERAGARFAMSFDIWEEKFAVTRLGWSRKSVSHLSAAAAETWCLDSLRLSSDRLSSSSPFWVRLEVRAEEPGGENAGDDGPDVSLARLVEFFSRAARPGQPHWMAEGGPFRLAALK
ncbi:MAG: hypothetical protein ABFD60_03285 [Bryobacteraceae bacterium]